MIDSSEREGHTSFIIHRAGTPCDFVIVLLRLLPLKMEAKNNSIINNNGTEATNTLLKATKPFRKELTSCFGSEEQLCKKQ